MDTNNSDFTAEDMASLPKTIAELLETVTEMHGTALRNVVLCVEEISNALRRYASYATDLPAPNGDEAKKSEIVNMWRDQADHMTNCTNALWNTAVSPQSMVEELNKMLLLGVQTFYEERARDIDRMHVAPMRSEIENIMGERANNIAEAYRGRVLPEPFKAHELTEKTK